MILNVELAEHQIRETKVLTLTSSRLEKTIINYAYHGEGRIKDPAVENTRLPPIVNIFYSYVFDNDDVPSPAAVVRDYLAQDYFTHLRGNRVGIEFDTTSIAVDGDALVARILRTYPSLVRDLHFYLLAVESDLFQTVRYSSRDDVEKGVDIRIKAHDAWFNIALLQSSPRARLFREVKKGRHNQTQTNLIYIELDQKHCKRCGDFYLFSDWHIAKVNEIILEKCCLKQ